MKSIKSAQISNTMIGWFIFAFLLVLVVYFIGIPFFKERVVPWAENLWGSKNTVISSSSGGGSSAGGGVAITPFIIPNVQVGEGECSIQIGYLGESYKFATGGYSYRKIYLFDSTNIGKDWGLRYPTYFDASNMYKSNVRYDYKKFYMFPINLPNKAQFGNVQLEFLFNLKSLTNMFPEAVQNLKKLEGAYIKPSDQDKIEDSNAKPAICITKKTQELQKQRLAEKEIGYVSQLVDSSGNAISGGDYLSLVLGKGGALNVEDSWIFWTNIKIIGTKLLLFSNKDNLRDLKTAPSTAGLEVGTIGSDGKISIYQTLIDEAHYVSGGQSNELTYRDRLGIPLFSTSSSGSCDYGWEREKGYGYCRWGDVVSILQKLNGAVIAKRSGESDTLKLMKPRQLLTKVIIK